MWQRFTERSRRVVFFAQEEAGKRGDNYVAPEHLLLGVLREEDSVAAWLLDNMRIDRTALRIAVEENMATGDGRLTQDMQLTPASKRVIDCSYDEARQLGNNYIGTEHLILGLIREGESIAARSLVLFGADLEKTRRQVMMLQSENPGIGDDKKKRSVAREDRLQVGDLGVLRSASDRIAVEVAAEPAAVGALAETFRARDGFGYREMYEAGRFYVVPVGTKLKYLQAIPEEQYMAGKDALLIRVLEGEFAGRKGWITAKEFQRTGPDDAPFPPEP